MAQPRALFLPSGTFTSQATCTDVEGKKNYSPPPPPPPSSRHALPFPWLVMLFFFLHALHIPGCTREREMTVWLNNSNGLRVKKPGGETGNEVEDEVTGGRELINSTGFPH